MPQSRTYVIKFKDIVKGDISAKVDYTEANINDTSKDIKEAFKEDVYKILIVANKFQTGYDEPLLQTM